MTNHHPSGDQGRGSDGRPKPFYEDETVTIYHGDCREILPALSISVDAVIADPPYGDTSLGWDKRVDGWLDAIDAPQIWCFGSMRFWLEHGGENFKSAGWSYGQEVIWEKHNGSGFAADRFKRVHEIPIHFYRGRWSDLYLDPPVEHGHRRVRAGRRRNGTPHTGEVGASSYDSTDRLMRSVIRVRSEHGRAFHPTQKPTGILTPLITYSAPPGGLILDPTMGSGSALVAARMVGRRAVGIEEDERYCEIAVERLGQAELDLGAAA